MRISRLLAATVAIGAALFAGVGAAAEPGQTLDGGATAPEVQREDFDDPSFDAGQAASDDASSNQIGRDQSEIGRDQSAGDHEVVLGVVAIDAEGRRGRIHRVVAGDTLWDISEAYLGTAWVWPSVWRENEAIANPHLIVPGDRIWISSTEMRRLSQGEAEELLARRVAEPSAPASESEEQPVVETLTPLTPGSASDGSLSLAAAASSQSNETGRNLSLPWRESFGFVSDEALHAASSVIGSPSSRTWLAGHDLVYLGLGEGEVEVGQDYTVFRSAEAIRDLRTDSVIGHHVNILGWVRVVEVKKESSIAHVKNSNSEIARGDRVMPREVQPTTVALKRARKATTGQIVYLPSGRTIMGMADYVYIDRGGLHGLEVGSELEIFEGGAGVADTVRLSIVQTPDEVIARMAVVDLRPTSAVAYVVETQRELEVGDAFRSVSPNDSLASAR